MFAMAISLVLVANGIPFIGTEQHVSQPYSRLCLNIRHIHSKWYPWSLTTGSPTWNYSTIHTEVDNLCGPLPALLGIHTACTHFSLDILILFHVLLNVYTKNYHRPGQQWSTKFHRWTLTLALCVLSFCVKVTVTAKVTTQLSFLLLSQRLLYVVALSHFPIHNQTMLHKCICTSNIFLRIYLK